MIRCIYCGYVRRFVRQAIYLRKIPPHRSPAPNCAKTDVCRWRSCARGSSGTRRIETNFIFRFRFSLRDRIRVSICVCNLQSAIHYARVLVFGSLRSSCWGSAPRRDHATVRARLVCLSHVLRRSSCRSQRLFYRHHSGARYPRGWCLLFLIMCSIWAETRRKINVVAVVAAGRARFFIQVYFVTCVSGENRFPPSPPRVMTSTFRHLLFSNSICRSDYLRADSGRDQRVIVLSNASFAEPRLPRITLLTQ